MIEIEQSAHLPRIAAELATSAASISPAARIALVDRSLAASSGGSTAHACRRFGREGIAHFVAVTKFLGYCWASLDPGRSFQFLYCGAHGEVQATSPLATPLPQLS